MGRVTVGCKAVPSVSGHEGGGCGSGESGRAHFRGAEDDGAGGSEHVVSWSCEGRLGFEFSKAEEGRERGNDS